MNKEIWKDIDGYEGLYQVSNLRWASNVVQANNKNKTNIIEHMRKLGKSKKALLKRWHPEQFEAMAYKVGD